MVGMEPGSADLGVDQRGGETRGITEAGEEKVSRR